MTPALIKSRPLTTSIQTGIVTHDRDLVEARRFRLPPRHSTRSTCRVENTCQVGRRLGADSSESLMKPSSDSVLFCSGDADMVRWTDGWGADRPGCGGGRRAGHGVDP